MTRTAHQQDTLDVGLSWQNSFARLGESFFTPLSPEPLSKPYWVGKSLAVAREIGLDEAWLESPALLHALSGNRSLAGTQPLASVYSGHQFGRWAGQLGDGRAILLGETDQGLEIQLKGAGLTPYSRMGDGRAVLRSSIREFLCSEAMHGLSIPSTRALCVVGSDEPVPRETMETAAVVTRVAPSFVRFGHFEHFSHRGLHQELRILADYVIDRFYPDCRGTSKFGGNPYAALLERVSEGTARMVAKWQSVGFCHGVMNTDNMSILSLTIDYGPFQFLDAYSHTHICNHTDAQGRYAFNQQPNVAYWNLFCLGQALLPLVKDQEQIILALESYKTVFPNQFEDLILAKLGLPPDAQETANDRKLIENILNLLSQNKVDYTIFWRRLSHNRASKDFQSVRDLFMEPAGISSWLEDYAHRISLVAPSWNVDAMLKVNPNIVLRNHLCELAIQKAQQKDFSEVSRLLTALESPYHESAESNGYADFPPDWASRIEISCSS